MAAIDQTPSLRFCCDFCTVFQFLAGAPGMYLKAIMTTSGMLSSALPVFGPLRPWSLAGPVSTFRR